VHAVGAAVVLDEAFVFGQGGGDFGGVLLRV